MNPRLLKLLEMTKAAPGKIANTSLGREYGKAVTPVAENAQRALMNLVDPTMTGSYVGPETKAYRMAASPQVLNALKATPAIAGIYGTTVGADVINQMISEEDESFANTGMDLLGMGFAASDAAYGINRGIGRTGGTTKAGAALRIAAAAGLGKMGSDALQGLVGI